MQLYLLYHYLKSQKSSSPNLILPAELPYITVQLPIFNEKYVVERLLRSITAFDYPKSKFEIQILDDSTDETKIIIDQAIKNYKKEGFNISHIRRSNRQGFKAGALKEGMKYAKGAFIAIFDADFLPQANFLKETLPYFSNSNIGLVQTRWHHLNEDYSLLTKLQAIQLNVHFTVEQKGRKAADCFLQFNGTAGIWRTRCIEEAGGWEADTLTEDLDLSYRAQLKGWEIMYLEKFASPAELPVEINSLKSQQFRWMKGGAENARKLLPTIWKSDLKISQKIYASHHLLGSGIFVLILLSAVVSVPLAFLSSSIVLPTNFFAAFSIALPAILLVYYTANVKASLEKESYFKKLSSFLLYFPIFLSLSMGMSLHNSKAVIQGYLGKKSSFVRTPKFDIKSKKDKIKDNLYLHKKFNWTTLFEGLLCLYFLFAVVWGIQHNIIFVLYHAILMLGFGAIFCYSIRQNFKF